MGRAENTERLKWVEETYATIESMQNDPDPDLRSVIRSLPDRPLTLDEMASPPPDSGVWGTEYTLFRGDLTEGVIGISLRRGDRKSYLGYEEEVGWEEISRAPLDAIAPLEQANDRFYEWVMTYYGVDDIWPVTNSSLTILESINRLPDQPIDPDDVDLSISPEGPSYTPVLAHAETGEILGFHMTVENERADRKDPEVLRMGFVYIPSTGWRLAGLEASGGWIRESSVDDDDSETVAAVLYHIIAQTNYSFRVLTSAPDPETMVRTLASEVSKELMSKPGPQWWGATLPSFEEGRAVAGVPPQPEQELVGAYFLGDGTGYFIAFDPAKEKWRLIYTVDQPVSAPVSDEAKVRVDGWLRYHYGPDGFVWLSDSDTSSSSPE